MMVLGDRVFTLAAAAAAAATGGGGGEVWRPCDEGELDMDRSRGSLISASRSWDHLLWFLHVYF